HPNCCPRTAGIVGVQPRAKRATRRLDTVWTSIGPMPTGAVAASLLAALSPGVSRQALAQACGPLDASGSGTCTPAGNTYPSGINYGTADSPIHLTLQPDVNVVIPAGPGSVNAVNGANTGGVSSPADISITADGVTINNTANPGTSNNTGLRI